MQKKDKKKMGASLALVGVLGLGAAGTLAYLTDAETTTNTFTIGDVSIDVEEPHYPGNDSDKVKDLVSNEKVDKDPLVENTGKNEAIVFSTVDIPMGQVVMFKDKAADINAAPYNQELFTMIKADGTYDFSQQADNGEASQAGKGGREFVKRASNVPNHNEKWSLLKTVYVSADGRTSDADATVTADNAAAMRYVYGYNEVIGKGDKTDPIFNQVMLNNIVEGYVDSTAQDIVITSYAIQAANLEKVTVSGVDGNHVVSIADPATTEAGDNSLTGADKIAGGDIESGYDVSAILDDVWNVYIAQNNEYGLAETADENNAKDLEGNDRAANATTKLNMDLSIDNTDMRIGETAIVSATVDTNLSDKTYAISVEGDAVTYDAATGKITAAKEGTAVVKATSTAANKDGNHAVSSVTVTVRPLTDNETGTRSTVNETVVQNGGNRHAAGE